MHSMNIRDHLIKSIFDTFNELKVKYINIQYIKTIFV